MSCRAKGSSLRADFVGTTAKAVSAFALRLREFAAVEAGAAIRVWALAKSAGEASGVV
jgi:hypothetical protein